MSRVFPTLDQAFRAGRRRLDAVGIDQTAIEVRLLIEAAAGLTLDEIVALPERRLTKAEFARLEAMLARRELREPVSLILGLQSFRGLELAVTADVLSPRSGTEFVVEVALAAFPEHRPGRVLDLGIGSGAMLLAILAERPAARGVGVDASELALAVARENAGRLGLTDRVTLRRGDWAAGLEDGSFNLVVSNPPYIPTADIGGLQPEVRDHEPLLALDGGPDGLAAYRALAPQILRVLRPGGRFAVELGIGQAEAVRTLFEAAGATEILIVRDRGGRQASILGERPPSTDPIAGKARLPADRLADSGGEIAAPQARPSAALRALSGPEAGWAGIEASCDPRDYADFLEAYPHAEQAFEARRRKRKLVDWAETDQTGPAAVTAFLRSGSFAALQELVQATADNLARAAERTRLLADSPSARSREARAAAVAERALLARSFDIDLPGVPNWPRPVMVAIPPGHFTMGSPPTEERWDGFEGQEAPPHEVRIGYSFGLGRYAVTVEEFAAFVGDSGHDMGASAFIWTDQGPAATPGKGWHDPGFGQTGRDPVCCVNWHDAQAYVGWLNGKLGLEGRADAYRLPSEAEWEYACRAGTTTPFSVGAKISTSQANYDGGHPTYGGAERGEYRRKTMPVGSFAANAFGLYDMHANVWEWCEDVWHDNYDDAPSDGSAWTAGGDASLRVLRGGSWDGSPQACRSAMRGRYVPSGRTDDVGFRLASTVNARIARFKNRR